MARIAGINIPPNKHVGIALTHIFGTFVADLFALDMDYFRINKHMTLIFAVLDRRIHHKKPL